MPKSYAQRFAELIAEDPQVGADYAVQLYDRAFAEEVAAELASIGIPARVEKISGILRVRLPIDHPLRKKNPTDETEGKKRWPRKPEDRVDFSTRLGQLAPA